MIDLNKYQDKLLALKKGEEENMAGIATTKLNLDGELWTATPADREQEIEMRDEVADRFEDLSERESTERTFEASLKEINDALVRIENKTYGLCKVCGAEIETEKLDASPATATCKAHVEE